MSQSQMKVPAPLSIHVPKFWQEVDVHARGMMAAHEGQIVMTQEQCKTGIHNRSSGMKMTSVSNVKGETFS